MRNKKIMVLILIICTCIIGCGNEIKEDNTESSFIMYEKDIEYYSDAIDYITGINRNNQNTIKDTINSNLIKAINLDEYVNNHGGKIVNKYMFNGCLVVQLKNNDTYYTYKMKLQDDKISDCIIYNLYK